ncbi:GntT/GntP/DsdX family permease [Streptomyces sp. NPDC002754]
MPAFWPALGRAPSSGPIGRGRGTPHPRDSDVDHPAAPARGLGDAHTTDTLILANTAVAVTATVLLIVRWRVHPVIALLLASSYLGITSGLGGAGTVKAITKGFDDLMAEIGRLAVFGVLTGALLRRCGAIGRLVEALMRGVGPRRMPPSPR